MGFLGLRLVKRTVNFDDPQTYHFYYGDDIGRPGGIMTFFPWPGARQGRPGVGQVAVTSFAILPGSLGFWIERLVRHGISHRGPTTRSVAGEVERVIELRDPDGLLLELVAHPGAETRAGWHDAPGIPPENAVRGFHSVAVWVDGAGETERVLTEVLRFREAAEHAGGRRFASGDGGPGTLIDVRDAGGFPRGVGGAGTVHHVAWRATDDAAQLELRRQVEDSGLQATPVIDRKYFRSVYFREPGGVLYEIATDPPGFSIDEPVDRLGTGLMLPPQYERFRPQIEAALPPIHLPADLESPSVLAPESGPEEVSGDALGFIHRYVPPAAGAELAGSVTLLLLHGTGGDEEDLIPLGRELLPGAGLLSPRGKVDENGAPRFFRRLAVGVLDQEDLALRTEELAGFVRAAVESYELERDGVVAVGFSNGANIAASLLLRGTGVLRGAVLLSPMLPFEPDSLPDLKGVSVFIGAGRADPYSPVAQVERLAELLRAGGADVHIHWEPGGHTVTRPEIDAAAAWLRERITGSQQRGD